MRNLKKILALVLALMMTVSLMVVASAASYDDYSDKEQIDETYAEAVEVLAGIGMYQGDTEGTFRPQENLSRAEVATLLYRLTTGDYDGSKVDTYAGYDEFTDVSKDQWYAGYVNYAYVEGYVIGNGDGTFSPENNVTGAELATMLLRVLGRDAEGEEISGDDWALDASVLAAKLGLNENLPSVFMSKDATREQTAQMIFNALQIETYWNWSGNYRPTGDTLIGLKSTRGRDIWGRPGDQWSTNSGNVAFLEDEPVAVYYTAETECDIATDLGAALKAGYKVYTNGASNESDDTINPLNRVSTLGEQGRRTEIYANKPTEGTIVYIDTFAAEVITVKDRTYDVASHVWTPAELTVKVLSNKEANTAYGNGKTITISSTVADYPYSEGDILAVNKLTSDNNTKLGEGKYFVEGVLSAKVVTVQAITQGSNSQNNGFIGTDGTSYVYNYTFTTDVNSSVGKLDTTAIDESYYVYTDARGNVMCLIPVPTTASGYGVVVGADVEHVASQKYALVVNLLQADGSTTSVKFNNNGNFYKTQAAAEQKVVDDFSRPRLISYTVKDGYVNSWSDAGAASVTGDVLPSGEADALTGGPVVNDDTVFFVANYHKDQNSAKYVFDNYSIYTGFKSIADLKNTDGTFENGVQNNLKVTTLNLDTAADAEVVLVLYSNLQTTPESEDEVNYAFLTTEGDYVDIYTDRHVYTKALINGVPGELTVTTAASGNVTGNGTGLYRYTNDSANGWQTVIPEDGNEYGTWTAPVAGVMMVNTSDYLTVADDCVAYLVNTTTGTCDALSLSVLGQYTAKCDIAVQYDTDGFVNLIYVVDADLA